ncbi:MAG: adenosylcobinamide-phosphate synthase CbiB [Alphaproteobacteria bacterium]
MLLAAAFGQPLAPVLLVLAAALVLDTLIGDPDWLYRRLPHPVRLIGIAIAVGEASWNRADRTSRGRRWWGLALTAVIVLGAGAAGWAAAWLLAGLSWGWAAEAVIASALLAFRSLDDHVRAVAAALDEGLQAGRRAVAQIVGRDPDSLDEPGVARAAVESLAENFSDGLVAPVFWFLMLGLPGLAAYKAVNTLDSMIGHRSDRYIDFGRAAARLDDAANLIPARLTGLLLAVAAIPLPGMQAAGALAAMTRDPGKHRSPNAGWPEAAMAGALGVRLAGPRRYHGQVVADAWMGDGRADLDASDIRRALRLYRLAGFLLLLGVVAGHLALSGLGNG